MKHSNKSPPVPERAELERHEKWLTDITEFQIPAGKVYLSPIIDCFDGLVISWTIGTYPTAELINTMLDREEVGCHISEPAYTWLPRNSNESEPFAKADRLLPAVLRVLTPGNVAFGATSQRAPFALLSIA